MQGSVIQRNFRRVLFRLLLISSLIPFGSLWFYPPTAAAADAVATDDAWEQVSQIAGEIRWLAVSPVDSDIVFAAVDHPTGGGVYRSLNGGRSWETTPLLANQGLSDREVMTVAVCPSGQVFAGAWGGGVFRAETTSWAAVNNGMGDRYLTALECDASGRLFAGTNSGGVFRSVNAGESWSAVNSGLANREVLSIRSLGTSLLAGTRNGVFISTNGGDSWTGAGLWGQSVYDFESDPTNPQAIWAATRTGGVFASADGGAAWNPIGASLDARSIARDADGRLYAGTQDNGVFLLSNGQWVPQQDTASRVYCLRLAGDPRPRIVAATNAGIWWVPPLPKLYVRLRNDPGSMVANGGQITYYIDYWGDGIGVVSDVNIANTIPDGTVLVAGSITPAGIGSVSGRKITWHYDTLNPETDHGTVSYKVQTCVAIDAQVSPAGTGEITLPPPNCPGSNRYVPGVALAISSSAATGYSFNIWSASSGSLVNPTSPNATFTPGNADATLTANYTLNTYALNVAKDGTGTGTVTSDPLGIDCGADCSEVYNHNTVVTLTAAPEIGSAFAGWSGACTGAETCVVTMDAAKTVTATFSLNAYTLTVDKAGTGTGTVTSDPLGIDCGADCSEVYDYSTVVTLTAAPAIGSTFAGWSGACTGTGTCVVTMDAAKTVTANFTPNAYSLNVAKDGTGTGTVTSNPVGINCGADCSQVYNYNTVVTLTAAPGFMSTFGGWGGACTGTGTCVVTMDAAKAVTATFSLNTYTLAVAKAGTGTGTVTSNPAGINCGEDCTEAYNYNTSVTLSAASATGSTFTGWSGSGCLGTGTCTVNMTANRNVTASFAQNTYTLTVAANPATGGATNPAVGPHTYAYGTVVNVTATPAAGYTFGSWSGDCTGTDPNVCPVTMDGDKTVTANFTQITHNLTVLVAPAGSGTTVPVAGVVHVYAEGVTVDVTATPAAGYEFDAWMGACTGAGVCKVRMDADQTVTANFTLSNYDLTVTVNPPGAGSTNPIEGVHTYLYGAVVGVTATALGDFTFSSWGDACSGTGACQVTMDDNKTVTANFTAAVDTVSSYMAPSRQDAGSEHVVQAPALLPEEDVLGEMAVTASNPVVNTGATVTWRYSGSQYQAVSNSAVNGLQVYLPILMR